MKLHPIPVIGTILVAGSFLLDGLAGVATAFAGAALCFGYLWRTRGGAR
jgi:hypothetical protein